MERYRVETLRTKRVFPSPGLLPSYPVTPLMDWQKAKPQAKDGEGIGYGETQAEIGLCQPSRTLGSPSQPPFGKRQSLRPRPWPRVKVQGAGRRRCRLGGQRLAVNALVTVLTEIQQCGNTD
jgi:hypothetical protein